MMTDQTFCDLLPTADVFAVLNHSPIGHFVLRDDFTVLFWNRCLTAWTGIDHDEIMGKSIFVFFPHLDCAKYAGRVAAIFKGGPPAVFSSQLHRHLIPATMPNGHQRVQHTVVTSVPTVSPGTFHALFAIQDETNLTAALETNKENYLKLAREIETRKKAEKKLLQLAQFDHLTGLANRALFREFLVRSMARARREQKTMALLFLDLDHFKDVNDSLGHAVGDKLLQNVSNRISQQVRANDLVARLGGDEFAIILDNCGPEDAARVASKIIETLDPPHDLAGRSLFIGSSIGIALYPGSAEEPEGVCKAADTAMYHAKSAGRNNFQFFAPEMYAQALARLRLENDMRRAVDQNEFILHYQPLVDAMSGRPVAMEALIRWRHSDLGLLGPGCFIPAAEKSGLISPIGEWVLYDACATLQKWRNEQPLPPSFRVGVNVSVKQLQQADFADRVARILDSTGLPARHLELELTESHVMEDPDRVIKILDQISSRGIRISIDDFGTGCSSLRYLKLLPADFVKIDLSFVQDIGKDANDETIIRAIITLAHSLGLRVIAEGVETLEQADFLNSYHCDVLQGYYYSRPLTAAKAKKYIMGGAGKAVPPVRVRAAAA